MADIFEEKEDVYCEICGEWADYRYPSGLEDENNCRDQRECLRRLGRQVQKLRAAQEDAD